MYSMRGNFAFILATSVFVLAQHTLYRHNLTIVPFVVDRTGRPKVAEVLGVWCITSNLVDIKLFRSILQLCTATLRISIQSTSLLWNRYFLQLSSYIIFFFFRINYIYYAPVVLRLTLIATNPNTRERLVKNTCLSSIPSFWRINCHIIMGIAPHFKSLYTYSTLVRRCWIFSL